jgi:hypothetical protein
MHIIALALLALLVGYIHTLLYPKLQAALPANLQSSKIGGAFFTGVFILIAFFLASMVLSFVGMKAKGA